MKYRHPKQPIGATTSFRFVRSLEPSSWSRLHTPLLAIVRYGAQIEKCTTKVLDCHCGSPHTVAQGRREKESLRLGAAGRVSTFAVEHKSRSVPHLFIFSFVFVLHLKLNSKRCEFSYGSGAPVKERRTASFLGLFTSLTSVEIGRHG